MTKRTYRIGHSTLTLEFGDITKSEADVLVSSDDSYVTMGGGVSAAILRAGGESILHDAAKKIPGKTPGTSSSPPPALSVQSIYFTRSQLGTEN